MFSSQELCDYFKKTFGCENRELMQSFHFVKYFMIIPSRLCCSIWTKYSLKGSNERFSSKNGECRIYYYWFAFLSQPQNKFVFPHRYFAKCLEEMFQNACRTCSMIIFPVFINSIIIVWYLINFSKVTKGWQKFWGSSEGKMFEVKRCFHVQMF